MVYRWKALAKAKVDDYIPSIIIPFPPCGAFSEEGFVCTRNKWHGGKHVAVNYASLVIDVWSKDEF
jgi:hypothetical protein